MSHRPVKAILRRGADQCRDILNKLALSEDNRNETIGREFRYVLAEMGRTLFEVTTHPDMRIGSRENIADQLYFWPGYESLKFRRRFSFYEYYLGEQVSSGLSICANCSTSHAFEGRCENCRRPSLTAAAFRELLHPHDEDLIGGVPFIPGSTHRWVVANTVIVDQVPLASLAVETGLGRTSVVPTEHVRVFLEDDNSWSWGPEVAKALSELPPPWPMAANDTQEKKYTELDLLSTVVALRRHLYSAWLTASMRPELGGTHAWHRFIAELADGDATDGGLVPLRMRLARILSEPYQSSHDLRRDHFNYWYTLPLNPSVELRHLVSSAEIGSAMFFSTYRIAEEALDLSSSWIQSIFDMLRIFETGQLLKSKGEAAVAGALLHEIKHLGIALSNRMISPLCQLFDLPESSQPSTEDPSRPSGSGKLGHFALAPGAEWIRDTGGFAPFYDDVVGVGNLLILWSMGETIDDLPFDLTVNKGFADFIQRCWEVAARAVICFTVSSQTRTTVEGLKEYHRWRMNVARVFSSQRVELDAAWRPRMADGSSTVWLGRALIAVFKNCVQHGDLLSPVKVAISSHATEALPLCVTISNVPRQGSTEEFAASICRSTGIPEAESWSLANSIQSRLKSLRRLDDAVGRSLRPDSHQRSEDVVRICTEKAGGLLAAWPSDAGDSPWTVQLHLPSMLLE